MAPVFLCAIGNLGLAPELCEVEPSVRVVQVYFQLVAGFLKDLTERLLKKGMGVRGDLQLIFTVA